MTSINLSRTQLKFRVKVVETFRLLVQHM